MKSFFPRTTVLWNALPDSVKCSDSLSSFKRFLSRIDTIVPPHFYIGERKAQVVHCKLRLGMSDLNDHLFRRYLSDNRSCNCGYEREDAVHYLVYCPLFQQVRSTFLQPHLHHSIQDLLNGNPTFSKRDNEIIFLAVQTFIRESGRFD